MSGNLETITKHSVVHSLLWKFFERCSVQIITFIVTIVLARLLNPQEYGTMALVLVFVNVAGVIVEGGLNTALIQKKDSDQIDFSTIFYATLGVALILYAILYFTAADIAAFYKNSSLEAVVKVLGISLFFFAVNSIQKAYLSKRMLFKKLFYSSFGAVVVSGTIGIYLAWKGCGVWALVAQSFLTQACTTLIMFITVKWYPSLQFSWQRFKLLFNYGWKIFASNMLVSASINVRSLIIGKVYTSSALALFDRGKQFPALIIDNINSSIQAVLFPVLSGLQDNRDSVKTLVRRSIKTSAFVIFPLVVGLSIFAEPLILSLLTSKWIGAIPYVRIFCIAYLLMPMQIANLEAIKSLGYSGTTLKLELYKKIIEFIVLLITIPISVYFIAWGIVFYNFIALIINVRPNTKILNYGLAEQLKDIFPTLAISLLMGIIVFPITLMPINPTFMIIGGGVAGIAVYGILAALSHNETYIYIKATLLERIKHKSSI